MHFICSSVDVRSRIARVCLACFTMIQQAKDQRGGLRAALPLASLSELCTVEGDVVAVSNTQHHNTEAI